MYSPLSSTDIGTLFQARNFLNSRTIPSSSMKDINAYEELLMKYCEALTVSAFQNYLTQTKICINDTRNEERNKELMETILDDFVGRYITPEVRIIAFPFFTILY